MGQPIRVRIRPAASESPPLRLRPGRRGLLVIVALFLVTLVAAKGCQQAQVRIPKERAVATARAQAGFTPQRTQVRLVRQGLNAHPFWAVSLSVPASSGDGYAHLTTVRVDANTGKVESVNREE